MRLNYNHLYYFHIAATEGSISAAAETLRVSQPTVSEQLRALEGALGVSLFERTTTGLKLTDAGRVAVEQTSIMFGAAERLVESVVTDERVVPRSLRVGITGPIARSTTTDFLMPLLAIEQCVPTIRGGDMIDLLRDLRGSDLDLVLCESEPPEAMRQGLESTMVHRTTLVVVAPVSVDPAPNWENVGLIQYRPSSAYRWDVENFLADRGLQPRIVAESDDPLFLVEAAARGSFVAIVPRSVARDAIAAGRLRALAVIEPTHAGVHALRQAGAASELARHAVQALIAYAKTTFESSGLGPPV